MLSFMFYMLLVLFVVCIVFAVLNSMLQGVSSIFQDIGDMAKTLNGMSSKGTGKQTYRVSIQYEKETESAEGQEVLHRVSSKHTRGLEEYLAILLDFAHGGAHFYCSFSGIKPPAMPVESRALASSKKPPVLQ